MGSKIQQVRLLPTDGHYPAKQAEALQAPSALLIALGHESLASHSTRPRSKHCFLRHIVSKSSSSGIRRIDKRTTCNDKRLHQTYSYSPPSTIPLLVATATGILLMFLSDPQGLLRAALSLLLFAPYPWWFRRWTILLPLLLPMSVQGRLEVVTSLLLLIWLHVGCNAEWWFVIRRLEEAWKDWTSSLRK